MVSDCLDIRHFNAERDHFVEGGYGVARADFATTLSCMIIGGSRDQLGGGFYRYSLDTWWHLPHFEEMLRV